MARSKKITPKAIESLEKFQPKTNPLGYLSLVLHAHLPYVRHPEEEYFLEENWLYEAITETYIPLIQVFNGLIRDNVNFRITMSLTPPLVSMLQDPLLQDRYLRHIDRLIELSDKEIARTVYEQHYHQLAVMYHEKFKECKRLFKDIYKKDIVQAFKKIQDLGYLEIITCCATHGFLPILDIHRSSSKAQIQIGADHYRKVFGKDPKGIWLAECGYTPGIDEILAKEKIRYFFVDTHGILNSDPTPQYGVYSPIYCPSGVAVFGRDIESSKQVWSAEEGYPGDIDYREYYKDIGFELDYDYIKPYIHPMGLRINTGMKYWRITGKSDYKEAYRPDWALEKAAAHAGNFMFNREKLIQHLSAHMDRRPIVIAPYDAELYGHWWYEGPMFIDFLMRKMHFDQPTVKMITPSEYLDQYPVNQVSVPSCSSWGYKGYSEFWLDGCNDWIYRHIHMAQERMVELSQKFSTVIDDKNNSLKKRALNQAGRELLLAESSDWPFIMKAGTMVQYANKRITTHIGRFTKLYEDILNDQIDEIWLKEVEERDNIFRDMDCAKYYISEIKREARDEGRETKKRLVKKLLAKNQQPKTKNQ
ncbi:MAG: DUF1957 domain-containing protein [Candidatus Omnitrophica bacterium]|nr:DUF1957 domain-containing protein [Candidatus Omnitrophota bacterium]